MKIFFDSYGLLYMFIGLLVFFAAVAISRIRHSARLGSLSGPLSADDRLRVSLALSALEVADKELAKAIFGNAPEQAHPRLHTLLGHVQDAELEARRLLRES